jgi:signal transduction histidine kinase
LEGKVNMSLRTKLLLSLTLLALVPLMLFGLTANAAATASLINVEKNNLAEAITSVNGGLDYIQTKFVGSLQDNANWDDMHEAVAKKPADQDFFAMNFDPEKESSTLNLLGLGMVGVWDADGKVVFSYGPVDDFVAQTHPTVKDAIDTADPKPILFSTGADIYTISYTAIRTSGAEDPNGMLAFGRKLAADDIDQLHKLTGYDIALYRDQTPIATTMKGTVTPAPDALKSAAAGQQVFDQSTPDIALAYSPIRDGNDKVIGTFVIWRPRTATLAAQNSITSTLALAFAFGAALALIVALILGRSITRPLLTMVNTADKIASGDLSQRVSAPSRDELGRLASAFNQMTEKVEQRVSDTEKESTRLQELDEFRLNLLTAITQALQTPVNSIKNYVSQLGMARYGTLNEAQQRSVEAIGRSVSIEEALLADLLDFSRAQQKQLRIARERVVLNDVLENVIKPIDEHYKNKSIQFMSSIPRDLPPLFADRTRMEQVLSGLIDWAYDYSKPNGRVIFSATAMPGKVQVAVTDTSDGLSSEELPKVFNLFYRPNGHNGTHTNGQAAGASSGLGLALIKALIEQQGGTINVEAEQGRGNVFTFTLPSTT